MTRQPALALGLLALALATAPTPASAAGPQQAKDEHAPAAPAKTDAGPAPAIKADPGHAAPEVKGAPSHDAPATGQADSGGHSSAQPNILAAEAPLAIWTVVVFGVLLLILGRFAWGPMLKAMHDREEHMEHCLLEAEKARNEAERMMVENQKNLARAAEQVRTLIEGARKDAESAAATIVQKAQAEAEAGRERAEREIGTARDQALTEIFSRTADLAVAVAGKVLGRELGDADQRRLVDAAMAELPAMANGEGRLS